MQDGCSWAGVGHLLGPDPLLNPGPSPPFLSWSGGWAGLGSTPGRPLPTYEERRPGLHVLVVAVQVAEGLRQVDAELLEAAAHLARDPPVTTRDPHTPAQPSRRRRHQPHQAGPEEVAGAEAILPGQRAEEGVARPPPEQQGAAVEGELGLLWGQRGEGPALPRAVGLGSASPGRALEAGGCLGHRPGCGALAPAGLWAAVSGHFRPGSPAQWQGLRKPSMRQGSVRVPTGPGPHPAPGTGDTAGSGTTGSCPWSAQPGVCVCTCAQAGRAVVWGAVWGPRKPLFLRQPCCHLPAQSLAQAEAGGLSCPGGH